jgi:hypothetical protein
MAYRKKVTAAAALVAVFSALVLFGPVGADVQSLVFGEWEEPEPSIESVEIVRAGCHDDVRGVAFSSSDGAWIGTVNGTSPHTELSAEIRLTSPDRADITTYRIEAETHNTTAPASGYGCDADAGAVRYRVEYDAPSPDGTKGSRVARYLDAEIVGCGGSTSGPEIGCARLMRDEAATYWSNTSGG